MERRMRDDGMDPPPPITPSSAGDHLHECGDHGHPEESIGEATHGVGTLHDLPLCEIMM